MAYTFDEVLGAFRNAQTNNPARWGGVDVYEFARQASTIDPNFQPVAQSNWIQRASRAIDQELAATGLPESSADIFGQIAGAFGYEKAGREAGRALPRQIINLLPLAAGGLPGLAASAALSGSDIYTQTGSLPAGIVGAVAPAAISGLMKPAGQLALGQLARGGARIGVAESGELVPTSVAQRIAEFTGRQAGGYVGGELVGEATSLAAGQGLYNPTTPESIISNLIGTIPFTGLDVKQYITEQRPAIARYSTDRKIDVQQPAQDVPEFTPRGTPKNDEIVQQLITRQARLAEIKKLEKTPELDAERKQILKDLNQLAFQRSPIPATEVTKGVIAPETPQPELFDPETLARIQKTNQELNKNDATSSLVALKTANTELKDITEANVSEEIKAREAAGQSSVQAVKGTVQRASNRAKEKEETKEALRGSAKKFEVQRAARKAEFDVAISALAPEIQQPIVESLLRVQQKVTGDPAKADMKFQGTVLEWLKEGTGDVEKLNKSLNASLRLANKPVPEASKVVQSKGKPLVYSSSLEAKMAADDLNKGKKNENIRYTARAAGKGYPKGSYVVREETWATKVSLQEGVGQKEEDVSQAEFDQDNFVQDVLEAITPLEKQAKGEEAPEARVLASAIRTRIDDTVNGMLDLSDNEIQSLGLTDIDVPTWREAFGVLQEHMKKGKIQVHELQRQFDEGGLELDAREFLQEPATVEMFSHMVKKLWGDDVQVVRGDDGQVHLVGPNGAVTVPGKVPSFPVQVKNLLSLWFGNAGFKPDEVRTLTDFGVAVASLTDRLDDVNLGVIKTGIETLAGLSDVDGAKIWLKNVADDPVRLHGVLAHELGHQISQSHFLSRVPIEWKQRYDNATLFLQQLQPEERLQVMRILQESLPSAFRDDGYIEAAIAKASESPQEAVAQATGMVMLSAVGKPRFFRSMVEMLPKPVADWVFHVLDVAKSVFDGLAASEGFRLGTYKRSKEFRSSVTEFRRTLDSLWKTQKDHDREVARLMGLETLTPDGLAHLQQVIENPLEVNTLEDANLLPSSVTAGSWMFNRMSPKVEDWYVDKKYLAKGAMKNFLQKFTPVRNLKEQYPEARNLFGIPLVQQRRREMVAEQVFTPFNLKWSEKGTSTIDDKGEILGRVVGNEPLQKRISDIRRDMNLKGTKYTDADLLSSLQGLNAKDRETVYSYVKSMTLAEDTMRSVKRESRVENVKKVAATFILKKNPEVGAANALNAARQIWDAIESGDPTLMSAASTLVGSGPFLDTYKFYTNLKSALQKFDQIEKSNPFYTTEKRLGRYFINYVRTDSKTDTIAFDDAGAWRRAQERLNADLNVEKVEAVDSQELTARHGLKQELLDAADEYDRRVAENIRSILPEDQFDEIRPYLSVKNEILRDFAAQSPALMAGLPEDVSKQLRREFKPEREGLNLVQNQLRQLNARVTEVARSDARADLMLNMSDPKQTYDRRPDIVQLIHQNYENYQMPDTKIGTMTNLGAFTYFLGGNLSNMAMEGAQWMVTLPSILTEVGATNNKGRGIGLVESWKRTLDAAKEVAGWYQKGKKWEDTEIRDLMEQASYEIDRSTGTAEDVIPRESMALLNAARMGKGLNPVSSGKLLGNPLMHYTNLMRWMYQIPAGLNNRIALVAGYRLARERGLSHQAAIDDAKRVSYLANFNEGKAGRPIAPFSNKGGLGRTAAQMVFSLQTYNLGMVSTFGRMALNAFSKRTDLTLAQRRSARRALMQLGATQFAIAGTLGMPFAGAALAVLNQLFPDLNAEQDVRETIALLGGHDKELGGIISRFATDGVLNQVLPIDVASRYGIGNIAGLSSYDGWSMENFFGPVGTMLATGWKAASNVVQGNMGQAFEDVVPIGFKNVIKLMRDDWKILDSDGHLLLEPTDAETFARSIGFAPLRLSALYKMNRLQSRAKSIESRRRKEFRQEVADMYDEGDVGKAQQTIAEKEVSDPTFDKNYEIRQITQELVRRRVPNVPLRTSESLQQILGVQTQDSIQQLQRRQVERRILTELGSHQPKVDRKLRPVSDEPVGTRLTFF